MPSGELPPTIPARPGSSGGKLYPGVVGLDKPAAPGCTDLLFPGGSGRCSGCAHPYRWRGNSSNFCWMATSRGFEEVSNQVSMAYLTMLIAWFYASVRMTQGAGPKTAADRSFRGIRGWLSQQLRHGDVGSVSSRSSALVDARTLVRRHSGFSNSRLAIPRSVASNWESAGC